MILTYEISDLQDFEFWAGGKTNRQYWVEDYGYDYDDEIMSLIEDAYPEGDISETLLNDIFWHEYDWLKDALGITDDEEEDEYEDDEDAY